MKFITSLVLVLLASCTTSDVMSADVTTLRQYARIVVGVGVDKDGNKQDVSNGSGVVIAPGYVLTAGHVVSDPERAFEVGVTNKKRTPAVVVKFSEDPNVDLALLYVPDIQCPCIQLTSQPLELDQPLFHVGYPMYNLQEIQYLTQGTIQGINQHGLFATTLIAPGSSGGGMFVKEFGVFKLAGIAKAIISKPSDSPFSSGQWITWMGVSEPPSKIRWFLQGTPASQN